MSEEKPAQVGDGEIDRLTSGLDNLQWNFQVQTEILLLGARAVPALVKFLHGAPSQFPDGRVLAAEALGRIGGEMSFQGLLAALDPQRFEGLNPVLRLSEETVQNAVARQLARFNDRQAVPKLLDAVQSRRLLGAAEALVQLREPRALPWLIEGLEDAFKRDRFAEAILEFGSTGIPYLKETLADRRIHAGQELLPSLERRTVALKLLGLLQANDATPALRGALNDPSEIVRTEAALALVLLHDQENLQGVVPLLVAGLTHPDFLQRDRCAEALARVGSPCVSLLQQALIEGSVHVGREVVPLTVNGRRACLELLERLKEAVSC